MNKKIYIAGKVSGLPYEETLLKFTSYHLELMNQGHLPVVPLHLCNKDDAWHIAMRKCIAELCTCDEIHLLPDWRDSPGAMMEHQLATQLGIKIIYCKK